MKPTNLIAGHRPHHLDPCKATCRVAFVTKNFGAICSLSNVGVSQTNTAMAKVLRRDGYFAEAWLFPDAAELERKIAQTQADAIRDGTLPLSHVIITSPSWATTSEIRELCYRWPHIVFVLVNHSGIGFFEIDINEEGSGVKANKLAVNLQHDVANFVLAANSVPFVEAIDGAMHGAARFLPNIYDTEDFIGNYSHCREIGDTIRIGGFGAQRAWKGQMIAAFGAVMLARHIGKKLQFFVNKGMERNEKFCQSRADLFAGERDLELVEIDWQAWPDFRKTVGHMHLMLQPSYDESFNVVSADGIAAGVASVVGPCISWAPPSWFCQTFNPESLVKVGVGLLNDHHAVEEGRKYLKAYCAMALDRWRDFLGR